MKSTSISALSILLLLASLINFSIAQTMYAPYLNFNPSIIVKPYSGSDAVSPPYISSEQTLTPSSIPSSISDKSSSSRFSVGHPGSIEPTTGLTRSESSSSSSTSADLPTVQVSSTTTYEETTTSTVTAGGSTSTDLPTVQVSRTTTYQETTTSTVTASGSDDWSPWPSSAAGAEASSPASAAGFYPSSTCGNGATAATFTKTVCVTVPDPRWTNSTATVSDTSTSDNFSYGSIKESSTTPEPSPYGSVERSSSLPADRSVTSTPTWTPPGPAGADSKGHSTVESSTGSSPSNVEISPSTPVATTKPTPSTNASAPYNAKTYRGFNVVNQSKNITQTWKNASEWATAIEHVKAMSSRFNAIRMYSMTDGTTKHMEIALPVIVKHGISVLLGVWSGGHTAEDRFRQEKSALDDLLRKQGCKGIAAVSVGNEDMYRGLQNGMPNPEDINKLIDQTQEIQELLDTWGCCDVPVTHTDTWGQWMQTDFTERLIRQVDFLTINLFPYWENRHIDGSASAFWDHIDKTKAMAAQYNKEIWIGEFGWPWKGADQGPAVANEENYKTFWTQVGCRLMDSEFSAFWYDEWDADNVLPAWGMTPSIETGLGPNLGCNWPANS